MKKRLQFKKRLFNLMRLSLIHYCLAIIFAGVSFAKEADGQGLLDQKVTIRIENQNFESVLMMIEQQADLKFTYRPKLVNSSQKISFSVTNEPLAKVFEQVFIPLRIKYKVFNKNIVLSRLEDNKGGMGVNTIPVEMPAKNRLEINRDITVSGKVTDETGETLPGVSVLVKGTTLGVTTDLNGAYSLAIPNEGGTLVFSFVGYLSQEVKVGNRTIIDAVLKFDNKALEEVIVVGYGTTKKSDLTGSVVSVKEADFSQGTNTSAAQLLNGVAAGVNVSTTSSAPGAALKVQIRGAGSINSSNNVLFVVDGLPGVDPSALSPDDIESIEVLKDASASTIYGTRAANGVVLITTKKGKSGKATLKYNGYYGIQNVANTLDVLGAADYYRLINVRQGRSVFTDQQIAAVGEGTNWQNELFRSAPIQNHQIGISNGNDKGNYYVGLNYFDQQGIVKSSGSQKLNARLNAQTTPVKNLTITTNINFTRTKNEAILASNSANEGAGPINSAIQFDPSISPLLNADNQYDLNTTIALDNPVALLNGISNQSLSTQFYGTVAADYKIFNDFTATVRLGGESNTGRSDFYRNRLTLSGRANGGEASVSTSDYSHWLAEYLLRFDRTFNNVHSVSVLAGTTFEEFLSRSVGSSSAGFLSDVTGTNLLQSGNGELSDNVSSGKIKNQLHGILGRLNYGFSDKYLATLSFRVDGSSRFAASNQYAFFPAASLGWNITNEDFMKNAGWLSNLKIRAGYGKLGNQGINNFETIQTLISGGNSIFGGRISQGVVSARLPNPNLKWETTSEINIGIDFSLINYRFSGSVDFFNRITDDQLFIKPLPSVVGFTSVRTNFGSVRNRGVDIQLVSNNLQGRDLKWKTTLNLAFLKNEVTELPPFTEQIIGGNIGTFISNYTIVRKGTPLQSFFGYEIDGIFQSGEALSPIPNVTGYTAGMPKFVDQNGDNVIDDKDRVILGDPFPDYTFGINNQLNYGNFALNFLINGVQGVQTLDANVTESLYPTNSARNSINSYFLDRWTPENPNSTIPSGVNSNLYGGSRAINSLTVVDASFVRLKNVTLSYSIPFKPTAGIQSLRIYGAAENLFTITKFVGFDPDASATGTGISKVNYNSYPLAKTFRAGLDINF